MEIISYPSPNFNARPLGSIIDILVIHHTVFPTAEESLLCLSNPDTEVSSHYLVAESGEIFSLVDEKLRAWHGGVSYWRGQSNVNNSSIGIELVNTGPDASGVCVSFVERQMQSLIELIQDILSRYSILAVNVVGHSDIAPTRKEDPGHAFDWQRLFNHGIGLWPDCVIDENLPILKRGDQGDSVLTLQKNFSRYGYEIKCHGHYDYLTEYVVIAFQRHFRQTKMTGEADCETQSYLISLLEQI